MEAFGRVHFCCSFDLRKKFKNPASGWTFHRLKVKNECIRTFCISQVSFPTFSCISRSKNEVFSHAVFCDVSAVVENVNNEVFSIKVRSEVLLSNEIRAYNEINLQLRSKPWFVVWVDVQVCNEFNEIRLLITTAAVYVVVEVNEDVFFASNEASNELNEFTISVDTSESNESN